MVAQVILVHLVGVRISAGEHRLKQDRAGFRVKQYCGNRESDF